jgi:hypothetical protein
MVRVVVAVALLITGSTLAGCSSTSGPCVHAYRDALVHVSAVVDSATGSGVDSVFVTKVTVNGDSLPLRLAVFGGGHETGVVLDGDTLRCGVPCAFGSMEGRWELTLLARRYPRQTVAFVARYAVFHGGCPSYNDRGTSVVLRLSRN